MVESICGYILEQSVSARAVLELIVKEAGQQSKFSTKPRPHFAHQWPDQTILKCISMQHLIKIYHVLQEL